MHPAVEAAVLRAALALPEPVQRILAGKPVVLDGQRLAAETQLMLRLQKLAGLPGAETLPIDQGRQALVHQARLVGGTHPIGSVRNLTVPGADEMPMPARLYTPTDLGPGASPLLVFFHGGGWIFGDLESHDAPCRFLAQQARTRVLAVDYRLAPEAPFPAAYDDSVAAYRWVIANAESLGADVQRLAVGGDSAGGNLAAVVALEAARQGWPLKFQLLVYPATDFTHDTPSFRMFSTGFFLTEEFMASATDSYAPDASQHRDPRLSPLCAEIPAGLAPAYVVTAGFDPLRDEGEAYARLLEDAGVQVELQRFRDQIHGFFNVVGIGRRPKAANAVIAATLKAALHG